MEGFRHHPNPITESSRLAQSQLPTSAKRQPAKGVYGMRRDNRKLKGFHEPSRSPTRPAVVHVGLGLVKWYLDNGMTAEARSLLEDIKAGAIDPRTGERK